MIITDLFTKAKTVIIIKSSRNKRQGTGNVKSLLLCDYLYFSIIVQSKKSGEDNASL